MESIKKIFWAKMPTSFFLRLSLSEVGYIGGVELPDGGSTTLKRLRELLPLTFDRDTLPANYLFLSADGFTIGMRREVTMRVSELGTASSGSTNSCSVTILSTGVSPLAGA